MGSLLSRWRRSRRRPSVTPIPPWEERCFPPEIVPAAHTCHLPVPVVVGQRFRCPRCWTHYVARVEEGSGGHGLDWGMTIPTPTRTRWVGGGSALEIETDAMGVVVSVRYEGQRLPYVQVIVSDNRAKAVRGALVDLPVLDSVRLVDP